MNTKPIKMLTAAIALLAVLTTFTACSTKPTPNGTTAPGSTSGSTQTNKPNSNIVMSDNPFDFTFSLEGTVLKLPCTIADLRALGYEIDQEKAGNTLDAGLTASCSLFKNGNQLVVSIYNHSDTEIPYTDAYIDDITISVYTHKNSSSFVIAGGLGIGSTKEEVLQFFGQPSTSYGEEDGGYLSLQFDDGTHRRRISFNLSNNIVTNIDLNSDAEYDH